MARVAFDQQLASRDPALAVASGEGSEGQVSDLLAAVKARVAKDKAKHRCEDYPPSKTYGECSCGFGSWPCDAARYISFAKERLAWIEKAIAAMDRYHSAEEDDHGRDAESELESLAKLLGVQG